MEIYSKSKVIFFVNSYSGGAEKMTLNIASYLNAELYDVVFYIIGKDLGLISQFIPADKRKEFIEVSSYRDNLIFKLFKVISAEKPDYVFSSLMPINWRLCLASAIFPKVNTVIRVNNYLYTQSFIQKVRLFIAYRFTTKLVVQTSEMMEEHIKVLKLAKEKILTLANPVNTDVIKRKIENSSSPFKVEYINYVYVGRIDLVKGLDILIQSFAQVLEIQPNALLHIIGETGGLFKDYYDGLLTIAQGLNIIDKVVFVGFSSNPYIYMKFADCFVLPSRNEGLPNVVIESLFLGTPVAVTNSVPVIKRIVREAVDGYVVEVDDISGLAHAMINSAKLGRVSSGYKSATKEDFQKLFQK